MNNKSGNTDPLTAKDWVVIVLIFFCVISSVLVFFISKVPAIWGAILLALSTAAALYHFLGGIDHENVILFETIRISGSTAIFYLVFKLIVPHLNGPDIHPRIQTWFALDKNKLEPVVVTIDTQRIIISDTALIHRKWNLNLKPHNKLLQLNPPSNSNFSIGYLPSGELESLDFFNQISRIDNFHLTSPLYADTILDRRNFPFHIKTEKFGNPGPAEFDILEENGEVLDSYVLNNKEAKAFVVNGRIFIVGVAEARWNQDPVWTRLFYAELHKSIDGIN